MTEYVNFETANLYFVGGEELDESVKKGEESNSDNASRGRAGKPPACGGGRGETSEAVVRGAPRRLRQGSWRSRIFVLYTNRVSPLRSAYGV